MKVIGYSWSQFKAKDSGETINGVSIYMTEERKNTTGLACERVYVTDKKLNGYKPVIGDDLYIAYNKYGKVDEVRQVTA